MSIVSALLYYISRRRRDVCEGYRCSLEISWTGWELQNRAWLPPIDRRTCHTCVILVFFPKSSCVQTPPLSG